MPTALISVYDKTGVIPLAESLVQKGWTLLATGGTLQVLKAHPLPVTEVSSFTGFPECFEGRVKTLHPKIHGGLLFDRHKKHHAEDAQRLGIEAIDLVVVNLYPFEATIQKSGVRFEEAIEQIDIGGPSMIRSAAKNHASVTVLTQPTQYEPFLRALEQNQWGELERRRCAQEAFGHTACYDRAIADWMASSSSTSTTSLPSSLQLNLIQHQSLRYGENPHQEGAYYQPVSGSTHGLAQAHQLQGKELSFNNLLDMEACGRLIESFQEPACVIVKHNNPCGVALGPEVDSAFHRALACDTVSSFGGIVAFNRSVTASLAQKMVETFWEVIMAPEFSPEALAIFQSKKQLRLIQIQLPWSNPESLDVRSVSGGYLVQGLDQQDMLISNWEIKVKGSSPKPSDQDLYLAQTTAKSVKSNAIVLVKDGQTVGIGAGQMSRVEAVRIACEKAGRRAQGSILGSDAFFPFADGLEWAAAQGVRAFIHPGGSLRDDEVMGVAQRLGVWLFATGVRHFRH